MIKKIFFTLLLVFSCVNCVNTGDNTTETAFYIQNNLDYMIYYNLTEAYDIPESGNVDPQEKKVFAFNQDTFSGPKFNTITLTDSENNILFFCDDSIFLEHYMIIDKENSSKYISHWVLVVNQELLDNYKNSLQ